ncbi:hypothetical protein [Dongia sp. agr-C8]
MNIFPFLAAFTLCISVAILSASFDDLRERSLPLDLAAGHEAAKHDLMAAVARAQPPAPAPRPIMEANEGLLDHELASVDPIQAWLDRTLTPPADDLRPRD